MKILQINKYFYLKGGADTVFFNTINMLRDHGHTVIPFCTQNPKNLASEYDKYFVYAPEIRDLSGWNKVKSIPRFFVNKDAVRKLELLIKEEKPDVAHIHNMFNGISLAILPVLRKHHIPVVITMHETRFVCPSSYFKLRGELCEKCRSGFYLNCALHKCYQDNRAISVMSWLEMVHKEHIFHYDNYIDKYIFLSRRFMDLHSESHKYFQQKGVVIPNVFVGLDKVEPTTERGDYYFYYGRLTAEKGVRTLIETFRKHPEKKLHIAGTGPQMNELQKMASDNITFLGFLKGDKLESEIRNSSFIMVPSECEENNPMTVIEAYGYGKPVIGSTKGGIPEIIDNGVTGFVFDAFSKTSLSAALDKAESLTDEQYASMSAQARKYAERRFNPDKFYSELMDIYNDLIAKK